MRHARCLHAEEKKAPVKRKELAVLGALREAGLLPEYQVYLPFRTCGIEGGACAYLDFVLYFPWGTVALEVDEFAHSDRDPHCELCRDLAIFASIATTGCEKCVLLRFNPDSWELDGKIQRLHLKTKLQRLVELLLSWFHSDPCPGLPFARLFMNYDRRSGSTLPVVGEGWPEDVKAISACV